MMWAPAWEVEVVRWGRVACKRLKWEVALVERVAAACCGVRVSSAVVDGRSGKAWMGLAALLMRMEMVPNLCWLASEGRCQYLLLTSECMALIAFCT